MRADWNLDPLNFPEESGPPETPPETPPEIPLKRFMGIFQGTIWNDCGITKEDIPPMIRILRDHSREQQGIAPFIPAPLMDGVNPDKPASKPLPVQFGPSILDQ